MSNELKNPVAEQNAHELAEIWMKDGKETAAERFNVLTVRHKIKRFEAVILVNRVCELLINNGYVIRGNDVIKLDQTNNR
jgi:hypothetical protein